jgi:signal transduction histidine kinase/ligand-binding sensor domain-containing protein
MRRLSILLGCILFFIAVASQEKRTIFHVGVDEGLSQGTTFDIVQDDQGFIWIATADGLNRFDGYNFNVFKNNPSDSFFLQYTSFRNLLKGKNGIWISVGNTKILYRLDLLTQKIKRISILSSGDGDGNVFPFKEDGDTLWALTSDADVVKLNWKTEKMIEQFPQKVKAASLSNGAIYDSTNSTLWYFDDNAFKLCSFSIRSHEITHQSFIDENDKTPILLKCIAVCSNKQIKIGCKNGILSYDVLSGKFKRYNYPEVEPGNIQDTRTLLETNGDQLWCGTTLGFVYLFDERTKTFTRQAGPDGSSGFKTQTIKFVMDKTKNLWIGTDPDGIYKIDTKKKLFNPVFNDGNQQGLTSNFVKCFLEVGDEIYIGTHDQCINVYNKKDGSFRYINGFNNSTEQMPSVWSMVSDSSGLIYVNTEQGSGVIEKGKSYITPIHFSAPPNGILTASTINVVLKDQSVLSGSSFGLFQFRKRGNAYDVISFPVSGLIQDILIDHDENVWACSVKGIYFSEKNIPSSMKLVVQGIGTVKCLHLEKDNTLWAGTTLGLYKIDPVSKKIEKSYSEKDGMPNNFVYGILDDKNGNLWLSTNKGLSEFDPANETFRNYTVTDGLQSNEFNTNAYYKTSSGELFFGGMHGFNHFYPETIKDNPYVPVSVITGLKIFDKPFKTDTSIEYKKHVTLDYTNNNLLLEYAALEFSDVSKNRFKYRMKGLDSNWVNAGKEHFARFVNLSPGEYVFQLKASNNDGLWNEQPLELRITITPPFWKTIPFIIAVGLIGFVIVFISIRFYLRRQIRIGRKEQSVRMNAIIETEEKERKRIAGELHDGLGQLLSTARLNIAGFDEVVHGRDSILLKNSLQLLDEACAEVRTISHNMMPGALIRLGLMEAINELVNKINDTEKIKIEYDTNLEERFAETIEIALYRIVQEVLNNMLRHSQAKNIYLKIERVKDHLEIHIADDGISFDVTAIANSKGLGWKNIYSRVEILNGIIQVESEKEKGTSIFISIPLR